MIYSSVCFHVNYIFGHPLTCYVIFSIKQFPFDAICFLLTLAGGGGNGSKDREQEEIHMYQHERVASPGQ